MLPEAGPTHHFGNRFSATVTQKSFKTIGKTNTFEDSRYPANPRGCRAGISHIYLGKYMGNYFGNYLGKSEVLPDGIQDRIRKFPSPRMPLGFLDSSL